MDGVGKSTLAKNVAQALDAQLMSTPGAEFAAVRDEVLRALDDPLGSALFYAATVSSQGRKAAERVKLGGHVVMDRYWASTVAYAQARGVTADLEALTPSIIKPDITVLITLDEGQRVERLTQRGATPEDIEALCPTFQTTVMSVLLANCTVVVDATGLDEQAATAKVVGVITDLAY